MPSGVEDQLLSDFPIEEFIGVDESDVVNSLTVSALPLNLVVSQLEELRPQLLLFLTQLRNSHLGIIRKSVYSGSSRCARTSKVR